MIIYVPVSVNGLSEVQEWLQTLELTEIFQRFTQGSQVEVSLPKFKVESTFELVQPLKSVMLLLFSVNVCGNTENPRAFRHNL